MPLTTAVRAGQANPAEDLYVQVAAALTAHANWEFVEETTVTPVKHSAWRCKGTSNAAGLPFIVSFARSTAAGALPLHLSLAEDYNATTTPRQLVRPAAHSVTSQILTDTGHYNNTSTQFPLLSTLPLTTDDRAIAQFPVTTSTSSYTYYVVVHNNGIHLATMVGTTTYCVTAELFESMVFDAPTNDPLPLVLWQSNVGQSSNQFMAVSTKAPLITSATGSIARPMAISRPQTFGWPSDARSGTVGQFGNLYQQNRPVGARLMLTPWETENSGRSSATVATRGWARGLLRTCLQFDHATGVVTGDTLTVGGNGYLCFNGTQGPYWVNTTVA